MLLTSGVWTAELHITGLWRKITCFVARFPSLKFKENSFQVLKAIIVTNIFKVNFKAGVSPWVRRGQATEYYPVY